MRSLLALALPLLLAHSAAAQGSLPHQADVVESPAVGAPSTTNPARADDVADATAEASDDDGTHVGTGIASYYGSELAGNRTASGETFNPDDLTAAHRTLAFGSRVRVTNIANGESVIVRINDRGPFGGHKRVIDVSHAAAREIGLHRSGIARVSMALLDQ